LIIASAPNGAYKGYADHAVIPLTKKEIVDCACDCFEQGSAMLHLHVRDNKGRHTLDPHIYREVIQAIHQELGQRIIIQVTSEEADVYQPQQQMAAIREVRPESVSLALREIVPDAETESAAAEFLLWLLREKIIPQFILYSPEEVVRYNQLRHRGVIPPGLHPILFVLGRYSVDQTSDPQTLISYLSVHDRISPWMVCAFGNKENACAMTAAVFGGHARVGFENNLYLKDGSLAPDNAALISQVRQGAEALGRPVAKADDVREMLD
jgi:uncharacterized protein (DUF849 family)